MRGLVAATVGLLLAGCGGGGGQAKLSNDELGKMSGDLGKVTDYCVAQIRSQSGAGIGGDLGQLNGTVSELIAIYKKHPNESFELVPGAPKQTTTMFMRGVETQLGTGGCAPDQSQRIEQALSG